MSASVIENVVNWFCLMGTLFAVLRVYRSDYFGPVREYGKALAGCQGVLPYLVGHLLGCSLCFSVQAAFWLALVFIAIPATFLSPEAAFYARLPMYSTCLAFFVVTNSERGET